MAWPRSGVGCGGVFSPSRTSRRIARSSSMDAPRKGSSSLPPVIRPTEGTSSPPHDQCLSCAIFEAVTAEARTLRSLSHEADRRLGDELRRRFVVNGPQDDQSRRSASCRGDDPGPALRVHRYGPSLAPLARRCSPSLRLPHRHEPGLGKKWEASGIRPLRPERIRHGELMRFSMSIQVYTPSELKIAIVHRREPRARPEAQP